MPSNAPQAPAPSAPDAPKTHPTVHDYIRAVAKRFDALNDDQLEDQLESYKNMRTMNAIVVTHAKASLMEADAGMKVIRAILKTRKRALKGDPRE